MSSLFRSCVFVLFLGLARLAVEANTPTNEPLTWDAVAKQYDAKPGELTAPFAFHLTNTSPTDVVINWVRTSCGCTVAKLPPTPWKIPSGSNGVIELAMDLRGKFGTVTKHVSVDTSYGPKLLTVTSLIPNGQTNAGTDMRARNMQLAMADRQAVFKNDCASCHVIPGIGKKGEPLYQAACAICHDSPHRATMVPDLRALKITPTKEYWEQWIKSGKVGSLMPAFAQAEGGPVTKDQIDSLVEYLTHYFPPRAAVSPATPAKND